MYSTNIPRKKKVNILSVKGWLILGCILTTLTIGVFVLTACDASTKLVVENRMPFDITIIHIAIDKQGEQSSRGELGTVPAGQTAKLQYAIFLRQDVAGWTILLKAQDPSGNIVWEKSWPFDEFLKLKDVGWKIVISPETNS
jgi:hypothetical protein